MWKVIAVLTAACSSAPAPAPAPLSHVETSAVVSYCIERETSCEGRTHTEIVNGKVVTVIGGALDCVGPRHVECTFAGGRRETIAGAATDVVGLGGGTYRYIAWQDERPSLVTVAAGRRTQVPGGAARTYGPFGPYGMTAQSRDGRIAASPVLDTDDEALTAVVVRDTTRDVEVARIALASPFPTNRRPRVLLSHDGSRAGVCLRMADGLVVQLVDRTVRLPGTSCVAADPELAQVIVRVAMDSLVVVDLASGRRTSLAARQAVFAGRDAVVMIVPLRPYVRGQTDELELGYEQLATERVTRVPLAFYGDEIRVAADGRSAIVFREKMGLEPPRALAVPLPPGRPYEIELPPDTVDITVVPE